MFWSGLSMIIIVMLAYFSFLAKVPTIQLILALVPLTLMILTKCGREWVIKPSTALWFLVTAGSSALMLCLLGTNSGWWLGSFIGIGSLFAMTWLQKLGF